MGSVIGMVFEEVLVRSLRMLEHVYPMPARLGVPLPPTRRPDRDADPIVLIGGFGNSIEGWNEWVRSLKADGFQVFAFDPPTFGLGDMEASAVAVAAFIQDVKRRTGRSRVDVVGFSEGGLLTRMAIARLGALGSVDRLVCLATPHGGVPLGGLHDAIRAVPLLGAAIPAALTQLVDGSALLHRIEREDRELRLGPRDPRAPRYASVFSRTIDMVVTPMSAWLPGAFNVPVESDSGRGAGPTHFEMYHTSDRAYEAARILLLDGPDREAAAAGLRSRAVDPAES